jgi:TIR domain/Domain of unknown function (DUF4352)
MTHDVFICHSSKDRALANAICAKLEQNRIRCWIAPRDVLGGRDFAEAIIEAISEAKLTVLVFSDNSNRSVHVHHEIERTVGHGIPILPLRVDDVVPSPSLEYFISGAHWLDAITPPMEQHLDHVVGTVRMLLSRARETEPNPVRQPPEATSPPETGPWSEDAGRSARGAKLPPWWRWAALAAAAVVVAVIAGILVLGGRASSGTQTSAAVSSPPSAAPSGVATLAVPVASTVKLGNSITLHGTDAGSVAAVTATKVADPTSSPDGVSTPGPGDRFVGVEFQIKNTGTIVYDDTPDNGATLIDTDGHRYDATTVLSIAAGPIFDTSVTLAQGKQAVGYIVFEAPTTAKVAIVQFSMDSGYGVDTGRWTLR